MRENETAAASSRPKGRRQTIALRVLFATGAAAAIVIAITVLEVQLQISREATIAAKSAAAAKKTADRWALPKVWGFGAVAGDTTAIALLTTKCVSGSVSYQISIGGEAVVAKIRRSASWTPPFTIIFRDSAGFRIASIPLAHEDAVAILGKGTSVVSYDWDGMTAMSCNTYESASRWDLLSRLPA